MHLRLGIFAFTRFMISGRTEASTMKIQRYSNTWEKPEDIFHSVKTFRILTYDFTITSVTKLVSKLGPQRNKEIDQNLVRTFQTVYNFIAIKVTGVGTLTPAINQLKLDIASREMLTSCHK